MRFWIVLLTILPVINGCTMYYKPVSEWEERVMKESVFDIYPDDVRSDIKGYLNKQVAWAGLIEKVEINETKTPAVMNLVVKHHFFSWAIDGTTRKYWLSPKGEGNFRTSWPMKPEWDLNKMRKLILVGDMVIVYGIPTSVDENQEIDLGQAKYIRHLPKSAFRTDVIEYGRPGEPTKVLSVF